jgi:hypothetical protein
MWCLIEILRSRHVGLPIRFLNIYKRPLLGTPWICFTRTKVQIVTQAFGVSRQTCVCVRLIVCVWGKVRVWVCVCERERGKVCVCVRVCVCARARILRLQRQITRIVRAVSTASCSESMTSRASNVPLIFTTRISQPAATTTIEPVWLRSRHVGLPLRSV